MVTMSKRIQIQESFKKEELHDLLISNRFLDDEGILYILEYADTEAWNHIYENRKLYAHRIQTLIEPYDFLPDRSKIKMRHTDLTDDLMIEIEKERRNAKMKEFEVHWNTIKGMIPDRPVDDVDNDFDDAWQALSSAIDEITAYLESRSGVYMAPSARSRVSPEQEKLENAYKSRKKEFEELEKLIAKADEEYLATKKNECFEEWLRQL